MELKIEHAPMFSTGADWAAACHAADWPTPTDAQQKCIDEARTAFLDICILIQGALRESHGAVLLAESVLNSQGALSSITDSLSRLGGE